MSQFSSPVTLHLADQTGTAREVECVRAVRVITGKRSVYEARWNDRLVFAKLFYHKRHSRQHWQREKRRIEALTAGGILTPTLLYAGGVSDSGVYILITEAVIGAKTLAKEWDLADNDESKVNILRASAQVLAAQHKHGLLQADVHLANFLLADGKIYSIDASKIRLYKHAVSKRRSLMNLGLLLAQFDPVFDRYADTVFQAYAAARNWAITGDDVVTIRACLNKNREKRKVKFLKKIFRQCTAFACRKEREIVLVYDKRYASEGFQRLFAQPESVFVGEGGEFLKRGNTATIVVADIDGIRVVIKRYNIKGLWHGIKRAFRRTRAWISWRNAHLLRLYGIDTPQPIAFIEQRLGPIRRTSYFVNEYIEGQSYREYFEGETISDEHKEHMAAKIAHTLSTLSRFRIRHGDMKATNIIVAGDHPYLIDLDAMHEYKTAVLFRRAHRDDIRRFLDNWPANSQMRRLFAEHIEVAAKRIAHQPATLGL